MLVPTSGLGLESSGSCFYSYLEDLLIDALGSGLDDWLQLLLGVLVHESRYELAHVPTVVTGVT